MIFTAYGHKNLLATHETTLEFTKDKELTRDGDCIVGVNSDFSLDELKKVIEENKKIKISIEVDELKEEIICEVNKDFNDDKEIVIRKTDFVSKRTLGINANKSASELSRELVDKLKNPEQKIVVRIGIFK